MLTPGEPFPDTAPEAGAKYAELAHAAANVRIVLAGRRLAQRIKDCWPTPRRRGQLDRREQLDRRPRPTARQLRLPSS